MALNRSAALGAASALACLLVATGCYTFSPARVEQARPDQAIRVRLAPGEASRLAGFADAQTRTLEGRLVESTADSVLVLVPSHTELRGTRVETLYQRVQVARQGMVELELKSLDRPRTLLVSGLAAVAVAAFAADRLSGGSGAEVVTPGGGPNDTLLPAVRIPFRLWALLGR